MASSSSAAVVPTLDELVERIRATQPADVEQQLVPLLRRLDKAKGQPAAAGETSATSGSGGGGAADAGGSGTARRTRAGETAAAGARPPATGGTESTGPAAASTTTTTTTTTQTAGSHLLEGSLRDGSDPLAVLDPTLHSIGYLYILNARLAGTKPDWDTLAPFVQGWCDRCDVEAVRGAPEEVLYFANQLCALAESKNQLALPIQPLDSLISRYHLPGHMTALHPLFLRVVMASGLYPAAQSLLQRDITDFDKSLFPIRYQDHLLYHYLGGTILALLGDYARAADLLETCVSAPGSHASLIQVDAHKKLVLVQLLAYGKTLSLPRYTSQAVLTATKTLSAPYVEFAAAFRTLDKGAVTAAVEKGRDAFGRDLNFGLVALCEDSLRRRQVQSLTETFVTLTLGEICAQVGLPDAGDATVKDVEEEIVEMIATRQIFATVTPATAGSTAPRAATVVTFSDDPEPYLSHEVVARVTAAIEKAQRLEQKWHGEANKLEASKEFVQKAWSSAAGGPSAGLGGGGGGPGGAGSFAGFSSMAGFSDDYDYGSYSPTHGGQAPGSWINQGDDAEMGSE
ncbi:hypothetical protein JCM8202_001783 [Rhodotorula sphaerocarpa]